MPPIYKALASITVWLLFIVGWLGVLVAIAAAVGTYTRLCPATNIGLPAIVAAFGGGVACFILSVCAMKLRQMLE